MTHSRATVWPLLVLLFALALTVQYCSDQYAGESIEGRVTDQETGTPLEGVVVMSVWEISEGNLTGTNEGGAIQVQEAVTDHAGRYYLPAWGPLSMPKKKNGWWVDQYISAGEPGLTYFKAGYEIERRSNGITVDRTTGIVQRSIWNGKTVPLKPLKTSEDRLKMVEQADAIFDFIPYDEAGKCSWKRIPHMLAAVTTETEQFKRQTPPHDFYLFSIDNIPADPPCGALREVVRANSRLRLPAR